MSLEQHTPERTETAIERLRDRTDELELIISSLTIFALLSLPGWLFDKIADSVTHLSTSMVIASTFGSTLVTGICYGLAACFILHLMARAYWVGLIGLRTVFPDGINWSKTPSLGPLSRKYYQQVLPNLDAVILKTDKVASSLFAIISMLTLGLLWFGTIFLVTLVVAGVIGAQFGHTNAAIGVGSLALLAVFVGAPLLVWLLDAQLAARLPGLCESRLFASTVGFFRRVASFAYPQRLLLPVQLTLQTNTRPVMFLVALIAAVAMIVVVGNIRVAAWSNFTISNEFSYLDGTRVQSGFRSSHYEDMEGSIDRLRAWPRVDSFYQSGSFVRLFLPYQPLRDNLILDTLCESPDVVDDTVDCLRMLWSVQINDQIVPMADFIAAERADISMRGLIGLVPLSGLEPGLHRITVIWNASADDEAVPIDDRYTQASLSFVIPIAFSPDYERQLEGTAP